MKAFSLAPVFVAVINHVLKISLKVVRSLYDNCDVSYFIPSCQRQSKIGKRHGRNKKVK